jgi:acyl-CoA thioester hydrolase
MLAHHFELAPTAHLHAFCVAAEDIDELGHANNVVWVRWVNEAALAHATHVGLGPEACRALGVICVVRRHDIEYLAPAFEGQTIESWTWPESVRGATSLRRTLFRSGGRVLARAETTWVLIDVARGAPRRVPVSFMETYGFRPERPARR